MSRTAVSFEDLSLTLGGVSILDNVAFKVAQGSIHCIIGPNGGGKTSLIRCLLGQMPHRGRIAIDGSPNPIIGYVPQRLDFDLTLPITVENFMCLIQGNRPAFLGVGRRHSQDIDRSLATVGMEHKRKRRLGQLSGGERQRVLFAQALSPPPGLLVLDEPMTGLDQVGAGIMEKTVLSLKATGVTIVWVHHDLQQVKRIADCVTCINRQVMFSGPPVQVLTPESILSMFSGEGAGQQSEQRRA